MDRIAQDSEDSEDQNIDHSPKRVKEEKEEARNLKKDEGNQEQMTLQHEITSKIYAN